jgi:hypothetical protein
MVMIKIYKTELNAELDTNLIARSFKYCGVTTNNLADYGSQLRHFFRTSKFVDDLEDTIDDEDLDSQMPAMSGTKKPKTFLTQKKTRLIMKMNYNFNCTFFPFYLKPI